MFRATSSKLNQLKKKKTKYIVNNPIYFILKDITKCLIVKPMTWALALKPSRMAHKGMGFGRLIIGRISLMSAD